MQYKFDELAEKARQGEYTEFSNLDKLFLKVSFEIMILGGYLLGFEGACVVFQHYLTATGDTLTVDSVYFLRSPTVDSILTDHHRKLKFKKEITKITKINIDPSHHSDEMLICII